MDLTAVDNISILSHQNKISTKIVIESRSDHDDEWSRLGYTALNSNINTNYQARELRRIDLKEKLVLMLRFTLHSNYVNNMNIFNQVGIISLLVYGDRANPTSPTL